MWELIFTSAGYIALASCLALALLSVGFALGSGFSYWLSRLLYYHRSWRLKRSARRLIARQKRPTLAQGSAFGSGPPDHYGGT